MRNLYFAAVLLFFCVSGFGQALYKVENAEKEQNSNLIVEGKVVKQTSFWDQQHAMIYTSNQIKITKVFKGDGTPDYIEIMTQGGTVGDFSIQASDLLEVRKGDIGVFFCFPNTANLHSPETGARLYDVYASSQGFFQYDLDNNKAGCPFNEFNSIEGEVYPLINSLTHQNYRVTDPNFSVNNTRSNSATQRTTAPSISSISPLNVNAGATSDPANNLLTITGTGFGLPGGSAAVLFPDDNNGGATMYAIAYSDAEMVSWTDNQIQVRVPTRAGTGSIQVRNSAASVSPASFDPVNVIYSIITFSGKQSNLINANGAGGYTMKYSTNMSAAENTTFNRSLQTWIEVSGLNVTDGGTTGVQTVTGDGNCVVMMDNASANGGTPLASGVLAVCYSFNGSCNSVNYKPEFDIVIRSSYSTGTITFSYGPCPPPSNQIDLETVILHELGHGLNLGHINDPAMGYSSGNPGAANPNKLMHYAVYNGVKRTSPDYSAYQGSLYQINSTTNDLAACVSKSKMIATTSLVDAKDEYPATFPITPTAGGLQVNFDVAHATSNKYKDPPYNQILCGVTGTNVTNNLYLPITTTATASSTLTMTVSNLALTPSTAAVDCFSNPPTFRLALYKFSSGVMPLDYTYFGDAVACRSFTADGAITPITGLLPSTNYLLYVDGQANSKGSFKITFAGNALPLKLEKFTGEVKATSNQLNWSIATLNDVEKLVLQKSANAADFSSIYEQRSFEINKDYSFNDYKPFAGKNYYRLATYNKDGSVQYSNVVVLNREEKIRISAYPNPVVNNIKLMISSAENTLGLKILIYNSLGQIVFTKSLGITSGMNTIEIPATNFAAGLYKLMAIDKSGNVVDNTVFQKL